MKTISELNNKAWYRLLKVVFGLFILIVLAVFNWIIVMEGAKSVDNSKTTISCTYGDKKILTPQQIGIELSNYQLKDGFNYKNFFEGYNDYAIKTIFKNCYQPTNDDIDVFAAQKVYEVWGNDRLTIKKDERPPLTEVEKKYLDETIPKIENSYINSDKTKYLDYSVKLFDIQPVFTYGKFIKYFIFGNLLILLFFEILRRAFYYIVLGSIRPQKQL